MSCDYGSVCRGASGQSLAGQPKGPTTASRHQGQVLRAVETVLKRLQSVARPWEMGHKLPSRAGTIKGSRAPQWQGTQAQLSLQEEVHPLWDPSDASV